MKPTDGRLPSSRLFPCGRPILLQEGAGGGLWEGTFQSQKDPVFGAGRGDEKAIMAKNLKRNILAEVAFSVLFSIHTQINLHVSGCTFAGGTYIPSVGQPWRALK